MLNKLFISLCISVISVVVPCRSLAADDDFPPVLTDSIDRYDNANFRPTGLILPGALVAAGVFGVENGFMVKMKRKIRDGFQNFRGNCRWHGDDYIQYVPAAAYISLGFFDTSPRHDLRQRLAVGITAHAFMGVMVNVTKRFVNERRPDSYAANSFPSGHTAMAFTGAELVRIEYPWPYGLGAYAVASLTAVLRLYNDRHWVNDLLAGAGIGILSARMAYWMLPLYDKWFFSKKDRKRCGQQRIIAPCVDLHSRSAGLTAIWTF